MASQSSLPCRGRMPRWLAGSATKSAEQANAQLFSVTLSCYGLFALHQMLLHPHSASIWASRCRHQHRDTQSDEESRLVRGKRYGANLGRVYMFNANPRTGTIVIEAPKSLPTLPTLTDYAHSELPPYSGDYESIDVVQRTSPPLTGSK